MDYTPFLWVISLVAVYPTLPWPYQQKKSYVSHPNSNLNGRRNLTIGAGPKYRRSVHDPTKHQFVSKHELRLKEMYSHTQFYEDFVRFL
jgi:hypothetical protein